MAIIPEADKRSKQEVLEELSQKAVSYTPEWRFDIHNPDVGTAMALVFADMYYKTLQQYNKMAYKARNEFLNCLHASMKTSVPASGYVTFGLVNDTVEGVELCAKTALTTDAVNENGERIPIETKDDVYVSTANIGSIYESYDKYDYVGRIYESALENKPFTMFGFQGENLQSHKLCIGHSHVFSLKKSGIIEITLYGRNKKSISEEVLNLLCDKKIVTCSYSCEDGFFPFECQYVKGNKLCFEKSSRQPAVVPMELKEQNSCWIQLEVQEYKVLESVTNNFLLEDVYVLSKSDFLMPDCINANGIDSEIEAFFPFGEQFGIFNEFYIASEEALSKKGAFVHLSFQLSFTQIPLDLQTQQYNVDWKLVMPKGNFKEEKDYDITIEEVVWEYFNGNGWVRLFHGKEYADIFGTSNGLREGEREISFICPEDCMITMVGGVESYYIRARILKINNAYKIKGQYISPFVEETRLKFEYLGEGKKPDWFYVINNQKEDLYFASHCLNKMEGFLPWKQAGDKVPSIYMGSAQPFLEGPLRILWVIQHSGYEKKPVLIWEYYSEGSWREINIADETENFRKTGLSTFTGCDDGTKTRLFGEELYWIRIRDLESEYEKNKSLKMPYITGIHMNSVKVHTIHSDYIEFFSLNQYIENFHCSLMNDNIYSHEVWIKEKDLSEYSEYKWVKWESVKGFTSSGPDERHYVLDSNTGTLRFGNNKHGKIPSVGVVDGIQVKYSVGGGTETNLSAGKITGLDLAAGFINKIYNPLPLLGGYDKEKVSDTIKRCEGEIKHQFVAITAGDYEKLALEISGDIEKVTCFSGYNGEAKKEFGHVTLVILKKNYRNGGSHFFDLKEIVYTYLKDKISPNVIKGNKFNIVEPQFVTLQVNVEAAVPDYNQLFNSRKDILQKLEGFIDAVTGNFSHKGWDIGCLPKYNQIYNILHDSKAAYQIRNISISCYIQKNNTLTEVEMDVISHCPFVLPLNGKHKVKLVQMGGGTYVT